MKWVRPCLAVIFALGITAGFFMGKIVPEAFIGIASVAITWWFKSRDEAKPSS